jgi:tRNA G18 (ribose-2'-O)-methylase SpoU
MLVPIASASDPRLAPYLAVRERDLINRDGRFIVEGEVTLRRLIAGSRFPIDSLFLAESRLEPLRNALAPLDAAVPIYVAPQAAMDEIAGFHIHRGVLALARRGEETTCDSLIASFDRNAPLTLLALITLANHDNVGGCFRNAAALGADAVLLDAASCDPLYRKSIRVSAGTALSLPFARSGDGASILDALIAAGIEPWALTPSGGEPLHSVRPPARLAIVLGAEGPGLPSSLMDRCRRVSIPMTEGVDSLNVATAGAIALAHVFASRNALTAAPALSTLGKGCDEGGRPGRPT